MVQETNLEIAAMVGHDSLPRRNGALVFHDEWERRAFALAVELCEQGRYPWDEFREQLVISIARSGETMENSDRTEPGYFEHWLAALERTLVNNGIIAVDSYELRPAEPDIDVPVSAESDSGREEEVHDEGQHV